MEEYVKIQKIINDLYITEFPLINKKLQDTEENKEEIIDFFVKRFKFCDKIKPKYTNLNNLTQNDIYKIQISDNMRLKLYDDCKESKFYKDIENTYFLNK